MAHSKNFKFTPYARIVPSSDLSVAGLVKPPGYLQNLEIWYTADAPAANGRPFDRGLQELDEMGVVGVEPPLSASGGPEPGYDAWAFNLLGRFLDEDASMSVAAEPYTIALIATITGSAAVQDAVRFGAATTPYIRGINTAGTVRFRPDGVTLNAVDTGDAIGENWYVVVYQRSGSLDQIFSAVVGEVTGLSGTAGAIGSTDLWSETELGGVGGNEFDGRIAQAMAWSDTVTKEDIWDWARRYYNIDLSFGAILAENGDFLQTEGGDFLVTE